MREALLGKLAMVLSRAMREELAAVYRFATGEPLGSAESRVWCAEFCQVAMPAGSQTLTSRSPACLR